MKYCKFTQVFTLHIRGTKIGDEGFAAVASCLNKIDQLCIGSKNDEQLSIGGVIALYVAIQNRSSQVSQIKQFIFIIVLSSTNKFLITKLVTCILPNALKITIGFGSNCRKQHGV